MSEIFLKLSLFCILLLAGLNNSSGQIPNSNFENWTNQGTFDTPDYWYTSDQLYSSSPDNSLSQNLIVKSSSPYSGNFSIEARNAVRSINSIPNDTVFGVAEAITDANHTGFPFTDRPVYFNGYYKFNQGGSGIFPNIDTGAVFVLLTKWNTVNNDYDVVGYGIMRAHQSVLSYTHFSIPITYYSALAPDSAKVSITSSITLDKHFPATTITVDELTFSNVTALQNFAASENPPILYPNPASKEAIVKNIPQEASELEIRDFTGKTIKRFQIDSETVNLSLDNLPDGIYFYSLYSSENILLYSNKLVIKKQ